MKGRIIFWIGCVFALFPLFAQTQVIKQSYRALESTVPGGITGNDSVLRFFKIADTYMDADRYDSAEYWLSKVGDNLAFQKPGLFNYYYHSRQAEVFYYNNLFQIGQQQTNRALQIALQLRDSSIIADAYNLLGLFSLNLEKYIEAENNLLNGLRYASTQKTNNHFLPLSEVYHLHGNLGETYFKLGKFRKALDHFDSSIQEARLNNAPRAVALGLISAGEVFVEIKLYDTALACVEKGRFMALDNNDYDVALLSYGILAELYAQKGKKAEAYQWAKNGLELQKNQQGLNPYFSLLFMRKLIKFYKFFHDYSNVSSVQDAILTTEAAVRKKNNLQMESVLSKGLANENKLLQLEVEEARQKQSQNNLRFAFLLVIIALLLLGLFYYRNTLKQKMAMAAMREKIRQNLHDDIGAHISSLNIYSNIALSTQFENSAKTTDLLQRISDQSKQLMENMDDMVWSMKGDEPESMSLSTRLKNYGVELLNAQNIICRYSIDEEGFRAFKNFESRKNILLIIKEAMNNIAKYSEATHASLELVRSNNSLRILISDNGKGFDTTAKNSGNGMKNMKSRATALNGNFHISSIPGKGTSVSLELPIP